VSPLPTRVYHYTTLAALHGILENHQLFMSDARLLNDPSEYRLGLRYAREVVRDLLSTVNEWDARMIIDQLHDCTMRFLPEEEPALTKMLCAVPNRNYGDYAYPLRTYSPRSFVFSGSLRKNSLDMWRAYGDNGNGVRIEIDPDGLRKTIVACNQLGQHCQWLEMDYSMTDFKRKLKVAFENLIQFYPKVKSGIVLTDQMWLDTFRPFTELIGGRKHSAYASEKEWRMHIFNETHSETSHEENLKPVFRVLGQTLTHRLELQLHDDPTQFVKSLQLGPKHQTLVTGAIMTDYLKSRRLEIPVSVSKLPYR